MIDLRFDSLFERIASEWPDSLPSRVTYSQGGYYLVDGLSEVEDPLSSRYIGADEEIITREMHDSIFIRLHQIAPDVDRLSARKLSRSVVRAIFERRLQDTLKTPDLGWSDADRALVDAYFAANAPEATAA